MFNEDFGKDLGLVHQVVVASRNIHNCREFWASLAHNKNLLKDAMNFVTEWQEISEDDIQAVKEWLKLFDFNQPVKEQEGASYYFRTPHCYFVKWCNEMLEQDKSKLAQKMQRNKRAERIWAEMNCLLILFYVYSAVWSSKNRPGMNLMHEPIMSARSNLSDVIKADTCICLPSEVSKFASTNQYIHNLYTAIQKHEGRDVSFTLLEGRIELIINEALEAVERQKSRIIKLLASL